MSLPITAWVVRDAVVDPAEPNSASVDAGLEQLDWSQLDPGDVRVRIVCSAINYKDGLAFQGHPGVALRRPLIPGIDAAGVVLESSDKRFQSGDQVLIASGSFGTAAHGGLATHASVPGDWVFPLPAGWDPAMAATWGTAGFTAAQSVEQLLKHDVTPESGPVVVTGATGGVGIFAVKILAKLGFHVVASTGKTERHDWLRHHGATEVIERSGLDETSDRPLLKSRFAAAIDTVGGNTLATLLKSVQLHGVVTACGLVGGDQLATTVYPFILRGVTLCGIDSGNLDRSTRARLWERIGAEWSVDTSDLVHEIDLNQVPQAVEQILRGKVIGRTLVAVSNLWDPAG